MFRKLGENQQEPTLEKVFDNKDLASKGRFVVLVSFVLTLQSFGYIQLHKIPLVGVSFENTPADVMNNVLCIVLLYLSYKYWVYKRKAELESSVDVLSAQVKNKLIDMYFTRVIKQAKAFVLANGNLGGFKYSINPPRSDDASSEMSVNGFSIYHLKEWTYSGVTENEVSDTEYRLWRTLNKPWRLQVHSSYNFNDGVGYCASTQTNFIDLPFKYNVSLNRASKFIAYFMLPDFVERALPYVAAVMAFIAVMINI